MADPDFASLFGPGQVPIPGPPGDTGPAGPSPLLTTGAITTGLVANVTFIPNGLGTGYTVNYVLPQGPRGFDGQPGQSSQLTIGTVNSGDTPSASITGTPPLQTLNLVLPIGPQGNQGVPGLIQGFSNAAVTAPADPIAGFATAVVSGQAILKQIGVKTGQFVLTVTDSLVLISAAAPSDGHIYGIKNGAWTQVPGT